MPVPRKITRNHKNYYQHSTPPKGISFLCPAFTLLFSNKFAILKLFHIFLKV